eukprot:8035387-Pyramimonas_sp.AAC.1
MRRLEAQPVTSLLPPAGSTGPGGRNRPQVTAALGITARPRPALTCRPSGAWSAWVRKAAL